MDTPPGRPDAAALAGDGYALALDDAGILAATIRGVWTRDQVDALFAALVPLHSLARQTHGRVLALVRVESVQSPTVALHVRNRMLAIKQPGDRNAIVVGTMLSKLQIGRLATTENFGLFTNPAVARAWLLA